jgi:FkbM family methyltransferase
MTPWMPKTASLGELRQALVVSGLRGLARTTPWMESELVGVAQVIPKGGVCIDIGAAAGFYTAELARLVGDGGVVHSVEPLRFAHATASRLLGLRTGRNIVRHSLALGESGEELVMSVPLRKGVPITGRSFVTRNANGLGSNAEFEEHLRVVVDGDTLDGFCARLGIDRLDFVKIDVEGAELHVLRGGQSTIATLKPLVMVEVEDRHLERFGVSSGQIADWFTSQGYRISVWDSGNWREVDAVAVQFRNYLFSPPGWVRAR